VPFDPDKTPVRSPSGALRVGLVPCPACRRDSRYDCDYCADDEGKPVRYVPIDAAIAWRQKHGSLPDD